MDTTSDDTRLAEMIRQYAEQNEEWARLKEQLAELGPVHIRVPEELVAELGDSQTESVPQAALNLMGVRA